MKLIKLIFISACLVASMQMRAQEANTQEACYTIEILPASTTKGDTATDFQVVVVIDTSDVDQYSSIVVESSKKKKEIKVTKEERKDNPRIKVKKKNLFLDMEEWSELDELTVSAKKLDGSKVKLRKYPRGSEFTHKVVTLPSNSRDLKKHEGPDIVEAEN
ncbi:MAG: hypothetical protein U9R49_14045 [Bacteroidota bacterium]|nr:hypothetical protein [Bacteroidota bacterium]